MVAFVVELHFLKDVQTVWIGVKSVRTEGVFQCRIGRIVGGNRHGTGLTRDGVDLFFIQLHGTS